MRRATRAPDAAAPPPPAPAPLPITPDVPDVPGAPDVTQSTRRTSPEVLFAILGAATMIAGHVAGRASRDALFLSYFEATDLPKVMIGSALASIASAFAFSHWLGRFGPARVLPLAFVASAVFLTAEWMLLQVSPEAGAVVLYVHLALFGAVLISGFWSVINERFDPHAARQTIGRVAAAAAAGGVLGGLAAERMSALFGLPAMLLFMALLHTGCAFFVRGIGAPPRVARAAPEAVGVPAGLRALRDTPYLQQMMLLVALCAAADTLLDYAVKFEADARFSGGEPLLRFFAVFYTASGILGFLLQASVGTRVLRRFGLGVAMLSFPVLVLVSGIAATAFTRLWTTALARGLGMIAANSLFRSAFELLYTPLAPAKKRPTKIFVDIGAQRGGDLVTSGLILAGLALLPSLPIAIVVGAAVLAAGGALLAVRALERGYVLQLAGSLQAGQVEFEDESLVDATTAATIAATRVGLDREAILEEIRQRRGASAPAASREPDADGLEASAPGAPSSVVDHVAALYSADTEQIRRALRGFGEDPRLLVPHVIPLLQGKSADDAATFLARAVARAPGQLVDWLVDAQQPFPVRQRLARVLEDCDEPRALEGLDRLLREPRRLSDPRDALEEFDLRYHAAQSAARIGARHPERVLPLDRVQAIARQELAVDDRTWERQGRRRPTDPRSVLLDSRSLARINRSVEHVFTLLGLAGEREVMASTLAALYGRDPNLRGTALEYLDVTLPPELARALRPRLELPQAGERPQRPAGPRAPRAEMADELLRSTSTLVIDRESLRRG